VTATWRDLVKFFKADDWRETRRTGDIHYEKILATSEVLHSSRPSGKTDEAIGKDLFKGILRVQLRVSEQDFWACIQSGRPVSRPATPEAPPAASLPVWLAQRLTSEVGLYPDDLKGMTEEEGKRRLDEFRSRPR
jgi:hypothetical protein